MPPEAAGSARVVITLHGIRTFGAWQGRLKQMIEGVRPDIEVWNYEYGYFSGVAFLVPFLRWLEVRRFRAELQAFCLSRKPSRIDIVAHSFGTHVFAHAISGLGAKVRPRIDTVILSGSVLPSRFPWFRLIHAGVVRRLINDCGTGDRILLLSYLFPLFTGMAGRIGFTGLNGPSFVNRYFRGGHGHYFDPSDRKTFMETWWLPLLVGDAEPPPHDARPAPTVVSGAWRAVLQNATPLKLPLYGLLLYWVGWQVYGPRVALNAERSARQEECDMGQAVACRILGGTYLPTRNSHGKIVPTKETNVARARVLMTRACRLGDGEGCEELALIGSEWYSQQPYRGMNAQGRLLRQTAASLYEGECFDLRRPAACMRGASIIEEDSGDDVRAARFFQAGCIAGNLEGCRIVAKIREGCAAQLASGRRTRPSVNPCNSVRAMDEVIDRGRKRTVTLPADHLPKRLVLGSINAMPQMTASVTATGLTHYKVVDLWMKLLVSGSICESIVTLSHEGRQVTLFDVGYGGSAPIPGCEAKHADLLLSRTAEPFAKAVGPFIGVPPDGEWLLTMSHEGSWRSVEPIVLSKWELALVLEASS